MTVGSSTRGIFMRWTLKMSLQQQSTNMSSYSRVYVPPINKKTKITTENHNH